MRRIGSKKRARGATSPWRVRAVQLALALAGTGLMTAIAAAAIGAKHGAVVGDAMTAAIVSQQIAEGTAPAAAPAAAAVAPAQEGAANDAKTRQEILVEAAKIEGQMLGTIDHTEKLRLTAYKQKDIIRLNTITAKLGDMRQIMAIARQAFAAIRQPGQDIFVMRAKLSTVRQGWDRIREALAAAESASGDSVETVSSSFGPAAAESAPSEGSVDPTMPGNPTPDQVVLERPAQASPYGDQR